MFIRNISPLFVVRQRSWWDAVSSGGNKNIWRRNCVRNPNFSSRYNEHSLIENFKNAVPCLWLNLKFFVCLRFTLLFFFDNLLCTQHWCTINKFLLFTRQIDRQTEFHELLLLSKVLKFESTKKTLNQFLRLKKKLHVALKNFPRLAKVYEMLGFF